MHIEQNTTGEFGVCERCWSGEFWLIVRFHTFLDKRMLNRVKNVTNRFHYEPSPWMNYNRIIFCSTIFQIFLCKCENEAVRTEHVWTKLNTHMCILNTFFTVVSKKTLKQNSYPDWFSELSLYCMIFFRVVLFWRTEVG